MKRKVSLDASDAIDTSSGLSTKRRRKTSKKGACAADDSKWPEHFRSLFKVFKALNTVLAFCSSRKHLAITFPVIRSSVEGLLKQPLEIAKVAELKVLLPELIKFAYIPRSELRVNEQNAAGNPTSKRQGRSSEDEFESFVKKSTLGSSVDCHPTNEEDEHVLVLEFADKSRGRKPDDRFASSLPPAMTPQQVQKLVETRNARFIGAVQTFLSTTEGDSAVHVLRTAAEAHVPVEPCYTRRGDPNSRFPTTVPESSSRSDMGTIIQELTESEFYREQVVDKRIIEAREASEGTIDPPLPREILAALSGARNINTFYTHQCAAINAIAQGKHVIVSTGTASGKSVIYQAPVMRLLAEDPNSTAMFIYPTKALAQDQRMALEVLLSSCSGLEHVNIATYDGDTPQDARKAIRDTASIIFTNFDMLHASILPNEETWRRFLKNLTLIAIDELHYYSGVFGSHVAQIARRLRRICAAVGNRRVRFVSCSATIANPGQHMEAIIGAKGVLVVTEDGAPSGRKHFLIWNPPYIDPMAPTLGKVSSLAEATGLMRSLMKKGVRVILFCKIRRSCEMAMKALRTELSAEGRIDILERVMAYRGGYSKEDRRDIESRAFSGHLLGIVATNALELGVDIGVLDAVIVLGFPFGLASLRQQAGRAGRRSRDSLTVLVADALPIDQYYVEHPDELFDTPTDDLIVELDNRLILESHMQCAAHEIPLTEDDEQYFGQSMREVADAHLRKDKEGWYHTHSKFLPHPSRHVAIRSIEEEVYTVIDITRLSVNGVAKVLEEVEVSRAVFELYEGGVFIHQGMTFMVKEVSHDLKVAKLLRVDVNWITKCRDYTDIDPVQTHRIREIFGSPVRAFFGRIELKTVVFGYFKMRYNVILEAVDVDMPPYERTTVGMWIDVPRASLQLMQRKAVNPAEGIHSAQHAFLNQFSLGKDVRTECKVPEKEYKAEPSKRKRPGRLIFFDQSGKNSGISAKAFDNVSDILYKAWTTVRDCPCEEGCAQCIESPLCKEGNTVQSKIGALITLSGVLGLEDDFNELPDIGGAEEDDSYGTVVLAVPTRSLEGTQVERATPSHNNTQQA